MKYIKQYENIIPRTLGVASSFLDTIKKILDLAKEFNIKSDLYISKSTSITEYLITFPDIFINGVSNDDINDMFYKHTNFITNDLIKNYSWYTVGYLNKNYTLIRSNVDDIDEVLSQNKYNL
jgi:hypothetical protein